MGRSYSFECSRCGYRARVSGGADRGVNLHVQTITCRECHELYDAVTRTRAPDLRPVSLWRTGLSLRQLWSGLRDNGSSPPTFAAALNRVQSAGTVRYKWLRYRLQCPVSSLHHVAPWNDPDQCPKCGGFLEKTTLPFRLWD